MKVISTYQESEFNDILILFGSSNGANPHFVVRFREYLDPWAKSEFSNVFRSVNAIVDRHALPWDHEYVQCRLQNSLFAIANKLPYSSAICWEKSPQNYNAQAFENALEEAEMIVKDQGQEQNQDKDDEDASIRYSPPDNAPYADEVYYPPMKRRPDLVYVATNSEFQNLQIK